MRICWESAGGSHVGRVRKANEDSYRIDEGSGLFVVADGMGGHAAGEVASALAADTAVETLTLLTDAERENMGRAIGDTFREAQHRIQECCIGDPRTEGMGTTLTLALIQPDGSLHAGHIGDSRLYRLTDGRLVQLTQDHTWVQRELDEGRLLPKAARKHPFSHILTRVLTAEDPSDPDVISATVAPGDSLLLCSDGLYNHVEDDTIQEILGRATSTEEAVEKLIERANQAGGTDNITAVNIRIKPAGTS